MFDLFGASNIPSPLLVDIQYTQFYSSTRVFSIINNVQVSLLVCYLVVTRMENNSCFARNGIAQNRNEVHAFGVNQKELASLFSYVVYFVYMIKWPVINLSIC